MRNEITIKVTYWKRDKNRNSEKICLKTRILHVNSKFTYGLLKWILIGKTKHRAERRSLAKDITIKNIELLHAGGP